MHRFSRKAAIGILALLMAPQGLTAQASLVDEWGFQWQIGHKWLGGGWSDFLDKGWDADINIFRDVRKFRFGAGGNFASLDLQPPFQQFSISSVELHAFASYHFLGGPFQPYVQARGTWVRFRVEGREFEPEFDPDNPPEEGDNTAERRSGFGFGGVAGAEYRVTRAIGFEALASVDYFGTQDVDLTPIGIENVVSDGTKWGFRVGINWYP